MLTEVLEWKMHEKGERHMSDECRVVISASLLLLLCCCRLSWYSGELRQYGEQGNVMRWEWQGEIKLRKCALTHA